MLPCERPRLRQPRGRSPRASLGGGQLSHALSPLISSQHLLLSEIIPPAHCEWPERATRRSLLPLRCFSHSGLGSEQVPSSPLIPQPAHGKWWETGLSLHAPGPGHPNHGRNHLGGQVFLLSHNSSIGAGKSNRIEMEACGGLVWFLPSDRKCRKPTRTTVSDARGEALKC